MTKQITGIFLLLCVLFLACSNPKHSDIPQFKKSCIQFEENYKALNLSGLSLSYITNLESIKTMDSIMDQEQFFRSFKDSLSAIDFDALSKKDRLDYEIMHYQIDLNLERIGLEKKWKRSQIDSISGQGIFQLNNGKDWYTYFLHKWVDREVTPDEMYEFGMNEIKRVRSRMKLVQEESGMDSLVFQEVITQDSFFYTNVQDIQHAFETTKIRVGKNLDSYFPYLDNIPDVKISQGQNKAMAKAPAYYRETDSTFYYNVFDTPFNKRQISWIYIHEAMPGHHYQINLEKTLDRSAIQKMFEYYGYAEGYAAYVEELGYEIAAYQSIYDELGKWEWDIIRSLRVAMDVGLNYYGWSDEKALQFWKDHLANKDDIALREIARMKRWPAQVITYKYGANKILSWKEKYRVESKADLKDFHLKILENGALPFSILENHLELSRLQHP